MDKVIDNKMDPLISIVVPVYQTESYLRKCINSILRQTYPNFEMILVDDGSPDRCGEICDEYARKDGRIRALHKENGGLADARNTGTAVAKGEYITYIDSDDWVAPDMLERLLRQAQQSVADVVVCDSVKTGMEDVRFPSGPTAAPMQFSGPGAMERMLYQTLFDTSAWGKLFSVKLAKAFPFPKGRLYEDLFTVYKMLFAAQRVAYLPQVLYAYRNNPDSIMNRRFDRRNLDELDAADEITAFVRANCPEYLPAANARKFSSYSQVLRWMRGADAADETLREKREVAWNFLKCYRWKMMLDEKARKKNRIAAVCTIFGSKFYVLL